MAKNNTSFKPGNYGKPKGAISNKTKFWNELSEFVTTDGAEKFKSELMKLEGKEYVQAFSNILEFFKPKLARQEIQAEVKEHQMSVINIIPASMLKNPDGSKVEY